MTPSRIISIDLPRAGAELWQAELQRCAYPFLQGPLGVVDQDDPYAFRVEARVFPDTDHYGRLLRCLGKINKSIRNMWPLPLLFDSGVSYQAEEGSEVWQSLIPLMLRGKGDCEDLVAARMSEVDGKPYFQQIGTNERGGRIFHVVLKRDSGRIEDPSLRLYR